MSENQHTDGLGPLKTIEIQKFVLNFFNNINKKNPDKQTTLLGDIIVISGAEV